MASYTNHEDYDSITTDNDITIIELAQEIDLATYTPACMAKKSDNFDGKNAWVYGEGGSSSDVLQEVELPVVTKETCATAMAPETITDNMICAGGVADEDTCQVNYKFVNPQNILCFVIVSIWEELVMAEAPFG